MSLVVIDPLFGARTIATSDHWQLNSVLGQPIADIGMAPRLLAQVTVNEIRGQADGLPPKPEIFGVAAQLFATGTLDGESPESYTELVMLSAGLTMTAVRRAIVDIVTQLNELHETTAAELPCAEFGEGFRTRWVPRGKVFAGVMASNHPAPNGSWVQALFHGYSVLVRPGSRDPFTPRRLITALIMAGLPPHKIAFLPCPHSVGEYLLGEADRGIVYGGERAVARWRGQESVAVRGHLSRVQRALSICSVERLGFELRRLESPNQGVQREIDLFGARERVGFYNTFAAHSTDDKREVDGIGLVEVSRDAGTGEVHALRGPGFASMQFHAESVLTVDGPRLIAEAVRGVLG